MKETLKTVIKEQNKQRDTSGKIERSIPLELVNCDEILVISGIRRCGKSVLLQQIRKKQKEQDFFINFDDERLVNFSINDFQLLHEVFVEMYGSQQIFYFDEIQNIPGWERFVRRLYDARNKIFITGSNATMLSRELGTHLTGRYVRFELYPFSFREFLRFKKFNLPNDNIFTTDENGKISAYFNDFLENGGIPIYVKQKNEQYLKQLYESILYKDVMIRNRLTNEREILQLMYFIASNIAKPATYQSLASVIGVKNTTTVKNYLSYIENTYMLFQVSKFDFSLKAQYINPKKNYFIDNALVQKLGFNFSKNTGRLLENTVFIELKRRGKEIFYHQNNFECDFVIRNGFSISEAIQVCHTFENEITKQREINGLLEALNTHNLDKGLILTSSSEETIQIENKTINIIPVWKWMLLNC
ncbi:MAG: ATP-binding protein [Bacteroidota bacterium]